MSYCRWGGDNFGCDIYAYEDVMGGWTIHVASLRYVGDIPVLPDIPGVMNDERWREFWAAQSKQFEFLDSAMKESIDLPHAGESFNESTLEDFEARLLMLREIGYRFPDYVLEEVAREKEEQGG